MRLIVLFLRAWLIFFVFALAFARYLWARLTGGGKTTAERDLLRGQHIAGALERLGATFVKFGQILATRPDLLPPGMIVGLSRLQDAVPAARYEQVEQVMREELGERGLARFKSIEPLPVAAASVAQVHRAELDDGSVVAIKVQRPEAAKQIERDLSLMKLGARFIDMMPRMKYVSLPGAVEHFADALWAQLDFVREADNNRRLAKNFENDDRVRTPALHDELCTKRVLTMQFIDGVKPTDIQDDRLAVAQSGFKCIAQMVFIDGFVHADMHPGNMLFTKDGHVYLIDLGLVAEIPEDLRKPWTETFLAVATGDGKRAAELFYGYAPMVGDCDFRSFSADIRAHLASLLGKPLHELEVTEAVGGAMAILRKHHVQVDPTFTVVNLAMLVAEGIGKQLDPHFDVYTCAMPFLMEASLRYPTGKEPVREVPQID